MNMNPWFMERMAEYERDRIQRDMKQIRLEKEALQASHAEENIAKIRSDRPHLLTGSGPRPDRSAVCRVFRVRIYHRSSKPGACHS